MAAVSWDAPHGSPSPGSRRPACIAVADQVGAAALCFIVERSGRTRVSDERCGSWMVADRLDRRRAVDVLVCGPTPVDAQDAMDAFARAAARAVICRDLPQQVVPALDALDRGLSLVPVELLERARAAPVLTDRQRTVLEAVMAGQSNPEIAHALGVRPVTVKREVSSLFERLGACRRMDLIGCAYDLGYRKRPLRR